MNATDDLPVGYQFGDAKRFGVPCGLCIKGVATHCRTFGCIDASFRNALIGFFDVSWLLESPSTACPGPALARQWYLDTRQPFPAGLR